MQEQNMALNNLIYKVRTGSNLYGTVTEESDDDFVGIFIPNKEYVLGIERCDQVNLSEKFSKSIRNTRDDTDYTIYNIIKFIKLAGDNNPNIIELLYASKKCILFQNKYSQLLIDKRDLFLSKKAYHTFKGYAYAQRRKLIIKKENMTGRNELVSKFGYDTKFASHLIRLLLEAHQILIEKQLTFPLSQNNMIRDIKIGKYELEWVLNKAEEIEKLVDLAYTTSDLQHTANWKSLDKLQMKILTEFWGKE